MTSNRELRRLPLGQEATRLLKQLIIRGEFRPGERMVEERLAEQIGISRTPIREALHRLEQEGLLLKRPRGGYQVRPLTVEEVEDAEGVRAVLEAYAAELAARRAKPEMIEEFKANLDAFTEAIAKDDNERLVALNTDFHRLLHKAADSRLLDRLLAEVEEVVERISRALVSAMPAGEWTCEEHRLIVEAMAAGDSEDAAEAARQHVKRGGDWIVDRMRREGLEL